MFEKIASLTPGAFYRYVIDDQGRHFFREVGQRIKEFTGLSSEALCQTAQPFLTQLNPPFDQLMLERIAASRRDLSDFHFVFSITSSAVSSDGWKRARAP